MEGRKFAYPFLEMLFLRAKWLLMYKRHNSRTQNDATSNFRRTGGTDVGSATNLYGVVNDSEGPRTLDVSRL